MIWQVLTIGNCLHYSDLYFDGEAAICNILCNGNERALKDCTLTPCVIVDLCFGSVSISCCKIFYNTQIYTPVCMHVSTYTGFEKTRLPHTQQHDILLTITR